jgi:DNA-binding LacI/PurR family transcriptional regulator
MNVHVIVHVIVHVNVHVGGTILVTMAEVAKSLGVSVQTVSAVVNGKPGISAKTQKRVREAIDRFEYHPNQQARTLRGVRSKSVGVIIPSITNPYFPEFVKGIEDEARRNGYSIFLCNTDQELPHLLEYFSLIKTNKVSGVVCALGLASEWLADPEVERRIRRFARDKVSIVLNGRTRDDLPINSVTVDATAATRDAVRHLLELGHRRIGIISPAAGLAVTRERLTDFRRAFAELGHPLDESLVVAGDFDIEAGGRGARALMQRPNRPSAIIAANDLAAFGAIAELSAMGLSVPLDVSVLGFDDIAFARVYQPALTTIAQPVYALGQEALKLAIADPVAEEGKGAVVVLEARFVARSSTAAAR